MIDLYKMREDCKNTTCAKCPCSMPACNVPYLCMVEVASVLLNKEPRRWNLEGFEEMIKGEKNAD